LSGGLIGGLKQTGKWKMNARFGRNELIRRIEAIAQKRRFITLKNWDAEKFISEHIPTLPEKSLVYCDPPYYHKAKRLYLNHYKLEDHASMAQIIQQKIQRPWLVSYDSAPEIFECYSERRSFLYSLQYNAAKAYKGTEVFFVSDILKLPSTSILPSINTALQKF
jgi:DNA adenine methylase